MSQQIHKYFGLKLSLVREIDINEYIELSKVFAQWGEKNLQIREQKPEIYIHKVIFDIAPKHFMVSGIQNRLSTLRVSVVINDKQRENQTMRFINDKIGHRMCPHIEHIFGPYKNSYTLQGNHLEDATHFEEYLATVILKPISPKNKKVKFTIAASANPVYGSQTLKNVSLPVKTKFDFWLEPTVQVRWPYSAAA